MNHETSRDPVRRHLDWRNRPLDFGPLPFPLEDAAMNRAGVTRRINLMETAYLDILLNVPPGTPGKLDALEKLRKNTHELYVSFSTNNQRIHHECTDNLAA